VTSAAPEAGIPVSTAANSRAHPGVHYPIDVIAGSLTGEALALLTLAALARRRRRRLDG
jgi:MYXO-CTERM domain-containing protein